MLGVNRGVTRLGPDGKRFGRRRPGRLYRPRDLRGRQRAADLRRFCAALDRHALAYVGECNVAANREAAMAPAGAATIRALARGDDRAREQYLDIFSGRAFREAVITHARRAAGVSREIR